MVVIWHEVNLKTRLVPSFKHEPIFIRFSQRAAFSSLNLHWRAEEGSLLHRLPGFPLEAPVDGLGDGRLHQVHVSHHQRGVEVLQVLVEPSIAQVICDNK